MKINSRLSILAIIGTLSLSSFACSQVPHRGFTSIATDSAGSEEELFNCNRSSSAAVKSRSQYDNYYGTMITSDRGTLRGARQGFRWGITNPKPASMEYFAAYVKPNAKYKRFRTTLYADSGIKADLVFLFRSASYNGEVLKSVTLSPGETKTVDFEIDGVRKLYIGTELRTNHDTAHKLIIGEPEFYNCR